jgi:hypothetical protein
VSGHQDRASHEETASRTRSCPHHCISRKKSGHQQPTDAFALYGVVAKRDIVGLIGVSAGSHQSYVDWSPRRERLSAHQRTLSIASLSQISPDRRTAIRYPCQTLPGFAQGRNALGGNSAVNWSHWDWQAQIGDPGRDRLATHLTLHTMMSSHEGCFGTSKPIFRLSRDGSTA